MFRCRLTATLSAVLSAVIVFACPLATAQTLAFSGTPALGQTITFVTTGTPGGIYALAGSNTPGPTPLPPLGTLAIGLPFFFVVGPNGLVPFTPAIPPTGQANFALQIPVNLALFGQTFHFQSAYADPASPVLLSLTNGIGLTIANPALAPAISSIAPTSGGASGGTPVAINGVNFQPGATTVLLGGQPLGNLQISATAIIGTTPGGSAGSTVDLEVSTVTGGVATLAGAFTYLPEPPTITSITPDHCQIGGGAVITVGGSGLGPGTTIYLAGAALSPLSQSETEIVAFAPMFSQLGTVDVVAASAQGISHLPGAFRFTIPLNVGTGSDGAFHPMSHATLDTNTRPGGFEFTSLHIPSGVVVTGIGPFPLRIRCRGGVIIEGVLDVSGSNGVVPLGGSGGPGGFAGGAAGLTGNSGSPGLGPGGGLVIGGCGNSSGSNMNASFGTSSVPLYSCPSPPTYGTPDLSPLIGGSGGAGCSFFNGGPGFGGGGGGGAVGIDAAENVLIVGNILAQGGNTFDGSQCGGGNFGGAGSGGSVRIVTQGNVLIAGTASTQGGYRSYEPCDPTRLYQAGNGRWYIENWLGQTASGTTALIPPGFY